MPTFKEACGLLYLPDEKIQDCQKSCAGDKTGITGILNPTWLSTVTSTAPTQLTSNVIAYGSNIYSGAVNFYYDVDDVITSLAMLNAKFSESLANLVNVS